jgi:hypothetical protein
MIDKKKKIANLRELLAYMEASDDPYSRYMVEGHARSQLIDNAEWFLDLAEAGLEAVEQCDECPNFAKCDSETVCVLVPFRALSDQGKTEEGEG